MRDSIERPFASRGGEKLAAALDAFGVDPAGMVCADLGSNVGGFVDCLLQRGAAKVYAIDTGYGTLAYRLRKDARVVAMERTNAMHVALPESIDLVTIDVGWTRQQHILPGAVRLLKAGGRIITLIKPHYEADRAKGKRGILDANAARQVLEETLERVRALGLGVTGTVQSPIIGRKGNIEFLALVEACQSPRPKPGVSPAG
ncbi:MAG TPA: SAM-dependent methyltransferase [Phycisphaerae bacterium]|nr:SAM-dependent methyltransferase [Phycisphaerae bacterium]